MCVCNSYKNISKTRNRAKDISDYICRRVNVYESACEKEMLEEI